LCRDNFNIVLLLMVLGIIIIIIITTILLRYVTNAVNTNLIKYAPSVKFSLTYKMVMFLLVIVEFRIHFLIATVL
jgi:hypothetical protein